MNIKEAIMKSERLLNEGEYISYNELRDYFKNDKTVSNWLDRDLGGFILYDNTLYIESNNYIPKAVIRGAKKYAKEKGYIWSGDIGWVYESKINEISDLSANLLNRLRYTDLQLKNAEDNAVYREFGDEASDKETHPAFKKALDKYKKNSKLLAKRNKRKGVNENSAKKAIDLYKKHGMLFLDDAEGKKAYRDLLNAGYTMKKNSAGDVAYCIELDRMSK